MPSLASSPTLRAHDLSTPAFSAEFRLLLGCSRRDGWEDDLSAALAGPINWAQVLTLADFHGVLPPLYQRLCNTAPGRRSVPVELRAQLSTRFDQNARKNLLLAAELIRILDCLEAAGIAACPYKGPVLAESLYGDLALREFSDLDVLVRRGDVPGARAALAKIGFVPNIALTGAQARAYLASGYEYTFDGPVGKNLLEIQWNFVPRFFAVDFAMERILARCVSGAVAGRTVCALGDEDLLLALCVHAAKHRWMRLCWLRDIAHLVEKPVLQWAAIASESERLGIRRIVEINLLLGQQLLGATIPAAFRRSEFEGQSSAVCREIEALLPAAELHDAESLSYIRSMLRLRERTADRARFVARLALTPSVGEWQLVNLPEPLFPLYRAVRLARLAGRALGMR